ncbi:MAG: Gfo/Idh/MocA family oxidoreductase [Pseudomonadota bacterium]
MNAGPLRVACLGAGYFSQFHYGAWPRIKGVELVAACDLTLEAAQATGLRAFDDLATMLSVVQPDILDIIVPPPGHRVAIEAALAANVQTIICQKPFCLGLSEAEDMAKAASVAGAQLVVHENFRFMPWYRFLKDTLAAGRVGTPLQATFRLRPGDGQGPRAYLDRQPYFQKMPRFLVHETAVHWIDTFRFLFGPADAVYADLRRVNPVIAGEDAGYIIFEYDTGFRALFDGNRLLDHAADNTRRTMGEALIEGTEGTLTLWGDGSVDFRAFGTQTDDRILAADPWEGFGGDCVRALQSHVVEHLQTGAPLENTADDYLSVIRVTDAVYASAKSGAKIRL